MKKVGSSLRFVVGEESCVVVDVRDVASGAMVRHGDSKTEVCVVGAATVNRF